MMDSYPALSQFRLLIVEFDQIRLIWQLCAWLLLSRFNDFFSVLNPYPTSILTTANIDVDKRDKENTNPPASDRSQILLHLTELGLLRRGLAFRIFMCVKTSRYFGFVFEMLVPFLSTSVCQKGCIEPENLSRLLFSSRMKPF